VLGQLDDCRARRQVVILDCCFSGAFASGAKGADDDLSLAERFSGGGRRPGGADRLAGERVLARGRASAGSAMPKSIFYDTFVRGIAGRHLLATSFSVVLRGERA